MTFVSRFMSANILKARTLLKIGHGKLYSTCGHWPPYLPRPSTERIRRAAVTTVPGVCPWRPYREPFTPAARVHRGPTDSGTQWSQAVSDAEKIVGYPTSFMSLRCLLSDEFSNVAMHMRKLVGTKHPLLKTARRFIYDGAQSLQMRGLLVLLIAKAAGPARVAQNNVIETMISGIFPSQRNLAEITEMIHTAYLIHKGVVNIADLQPADGAPHDMQFGNKIAVLSGDFLLANASTALAQLYNTEVVELVSGAIGDLMAAEFTLKDGNGFPQPPPEGTDLSAWEEVTYLATGSLLAKSCKAALMLAHHSTDLQQDAFNFGQYVGFAHQLREDIDTLTKPGSDPVPISATSAPVFLHLLERPEDEATMKRLVNVPAKTHIKLRRMLEKSGSLDEAKILCKNYGQKAIEALESLGQSDANIALTNIVQAVSSS